MSEANLTPVYRFSHDGQESYVSGEQALAELHVPDEAGNPYYAPRDAKADLREGLQCIGPEATYWIPPANRFVGVI